MKVVRIHTQIYTCCHTTYQTWHELPLLPLRQTENQTRCYLLMYWSGHPDTETLKRVGGCNVNIMLSRSCNAVLLAKLSALSCDCLEIYKP